MAVRSRFIRSIDEMKQWQLQFCFFHRHRLELPPSRKVECLQNADPQLVIAAHRRRLESLEKSSAVLLTAEGLESHMLAYAQQFFDHMVARRIIPIAGPASEPARA